MIRVAIVEDEPSVVEGLKEYFQRMEEEYKELSFSVDSYKNAIIFLQNYKSQYELVLMDIEMPHMDGMTAAAKLRKLDQTVVLIFVTNMAQFAIKGYEVRAYDFIVKPVKYYGFAMKIRSAAKEISKKETSVIRINTQEGMIRLPMDSLTYVESFEHSLIYHYEGGSYVSRGRESLTTVGNKLEPYGFLRCKSSFLVNIRHIKRIYGNTVEIGDVKIPIGRTKKKEFLTSMAKYFSSEEL